jgi:hypothetical protein
MTLSLYENLSKSIKKKDKDLTIKQKDEFILNINRIDQEGIDLIYTLIKFYEKDTKNVMVDITKQKCSEYNILNIEYDLDSLPNDLKQILYKFLQLHINKMLEESIKEQR